MDSKDAAVPRGEATSEDRRDRGVELVLGRLLQTGVLLSGFIVLIGAVLYLLRAGGTLVEYGDFAGAPTQLRSPWGALKAAFAGDRLGIIQLGLLLLIATPIARVAFAAVGFVLKKDLVYVVLTLVVLALLGYGLFAG